MAVFASFLLSCGSNDKPQTVNQPPLPARQSAHSEAFNQSFEKLLAAYYSLKDNLITETDSLINRSAVNMGKAADSLALGELKADSSLITTARSYTIGIVAELEGLVGETNILEKRKAFQLVGDQLYDLIRTVQYDRMPVYHIFCPTAFEDQGANWLNNTTEVKNPYLPATMPNCGEIKDTIDFRQK